MSQENISATEKSIFVETLGVIEPHLSESEVLDRRLRGKRWSQIEVERINLNDVITDSTHTRDLGISMFGTPKVRALGQISPIVTAVVRNDGQIVYELTDGYHRAESFQEHNLSFPDDKRRIDSIELFGLSRDEILDLRILAANSVKATRFARTMEWMRQSYEETKWSTEFNLTILQAFSVVAQGSSGAKLGLSKEEAEELREWITTKSGCWGKTPGAIFQDLCITSRADPELVKSVRQGGGGHGEGGGVFTRARLAAVVGILPDDFEAQKVARDLIVKHDFDSTASSEIAEAIKTLKDDNVLLGRVEADPITVRNITKLLPRGGREELLKEILTVVEIHDLTQEEAVRFAGIVGKFAQNDSSTQELFDDPRKVLEIDQEVGIEYPEAQANNGTIRHLGALDKKLDKNMETGLDSYDRQDSIPTLKRRILQLEEAVILANEKGETSDTESEGWWKTIPLLSETEYRIMELAEDEKLSVGEIAFDLRITENRIIAHIRSALTKQMIPARTKAENIYDRILGRKKTEQYEFEGGDEQTEHDTPDY